MTRALEATNLPAELLQPVQPPKIVAYAFKYHNFDGICEPQRTYNEALEAWNNHLDVGQIFGLVAIPLEGGAAQQAPVQEPVRPDILEKLSYHLLERDDMTLDDCLTYLQTGGWHKVRGRTERSMVLQLTDLMASAPAQPAPSSTSLTALVQSPAIDAATKLRGEAKVMRTLLEESLKVLATLEPEDDNERARLTSLKNMIRAVVEHSYTVHS
jgi:hypothetical protein